jgi:ketosteroid isomerase-like protein
MDSLVPFHDRRAPDRPDRRSASPPSQIAISGPLRIDPSLRPGVSKDPWVAMVAASLVDYAAGHTERAMSSWHDAITWEVRCAGTETAAIGPRAVLDYHADLLARTDGTFRQDLVSLEASGGPVVAAHVRTTASRGDRSLDMPSLLVFEVAHGRIRRVTEIHGDPVSWGAFWE